MANYLKKKFQMLLKEDENEPEVLLKEQTAVLRCPMHCKEGCPREVKKFITKWKGVTSVNIEDMKELETNALVTVQGNFDVQKLVDCLWTKKNKRVEIESSSSNNPDTNDNILPIGEDIHDNVGGGGGNDDNNNNGDKIKNKRLE
ncbi:hypothetical protein Ddye_031627 [Dipteronia dyeriana]|uniref:HMA domain-containing protein n=1 Tax=Dipteronia dyeriana TaxID=168575 RepID=A0AAD9TJV4_9ROSI|nr:hypothetical protein Ddye_031627 [Dipteronia dyeriana]